MSADDDNWSDAFSDSEWDEHEEESSGYWAWLQRHEAAKVEERSRASCSTDGRLAGGRPSQYTVDAVEFAQRCFEFHGDNQVRPPHLRAHANPHTPRTPHR